MASFSHAPELLQPVLQSADTSILGTEDARAGIEQASRLLAVRVRETVDPVEQPARVWLMACRPPDPPAAEECMARILVIDDEEQIRQVLCRALALRGHEVVEASDGKEALRLQRTAPVKLVITDILMPEKDGIEVIRALRDEAPGLRIIAMSGGGRFRQTEALHIAKPLGAFATLRKPFELDAMLAVVDQALAA
jgi:CheY-like chemotaxis protein